VTVGVYPVTNSPSSSCSGTITVTGGTINVWARYTKGGGTNGTAVFSTTINGVNASGSFSVSDVTPQGHTSSNGSTGAGFVTLAPGTYNFTLVKSDVLSSGNNVRLVWSVGTNPNAAAEMGPCGDPPVGAIAFSGTANTYASSTAACSAKTCGRAFYRPASLPIFSVGMVVYNDNTLTTPYNGGGLWTAINTSLTFCSGAGWLAIRIDSNGVILETSASCP
jgi:hypothetical protein